jgi:ligand-binding SRPBCC domain-containing protein
MTIYTLQRELWVPRPLPDVFDFFAKAENLERITPPWMQFRIVTPPPIEVRQGTTIAYALRVRGIPLKWISKIDKWDPPHEFVDIQVKGPYKFWHHTHRFSERAGGTSIEDTVRYGLPFGALGRSVNWLQVAGDLAKIFDYRAQQVQELFR